MLRLTILRFFCHFAVFRVFLFAQYLFESRVMILNIDRRALCFRHLFHLLLTPYLYGQDYSGNLCLDLLEHGSEQFKSLSLVLLFWIFLCVPAQMDTLPQMIQRCQVLAPVGIEALQHDSTLVLMHDIHSDLIDLFRVMFTRSRGNALMEAFLV